MAKTVETFVNAVPFANHKVVFNPFNLTIPACFIDSIVCLSPFLSNPE